MKTGLVACFLRFGSTSRLALVLAWLACSMACSTVQSRSLEGQFFDESLQLDHGGPRLQLNGLGLRGVVIFKAYVVGLYLSEPMSDAEKILKNLGPKRLRLKIMVTVPAGYFAKSLADGVNKRESPQVLERIDGAMQSLTKCVIDEGDLKSGDVVDFDYDPKRGVSYSLNGKVQIAAIPDVAVFNAILKIFIGDKPIDARLKQGVLGL